MRLTKFTIILCLIAFLAPYSWGQEAVSNSTSHPTETKTPADGPYLMYLPDGSVRMISVDTTGVCKDTLLKELPSDFSFPVISHDGKHHFQVKLHAISRPVWKQKKPKKLFVISDPHGNVDCFISALRANQVINDRYEWNFGSNHLMIIGDVFDRGMDVLPIFWLIYKLEKEAQDAGGQVSFLLGNHEAMILASDLRYMEKPYQQLAGKVGISYPRLFGKDTELGRWLATRNTMQLIGDDLFVHAGLSETFLNQKLDIPQVNEAMSEGLFMTKKERNKLSPRTELLFGSQGPIWYRGMVRNDEKYQPLETEILDKILQRYQAKRVIVGHTIFPDIRSFYGGKVIAVNVDNEENFEKVLGRGILIIGKDTFVISDKGILLKL